MAKDKAAQAAGEMVNIRLPDPAGGAQGEELPLRLAIIGDFTGKADDTAVAERKMRDVNAKNFDNIMAGMNISMSYAVENKLSGKPDEQIPVDLKISGMRSFRPEEVAQQVPQLRDLVALRKRLIELRAEAVRNPAKLKQLTEILAQLSAK